MEANADIKDAHAMQAYKALTNNKPPSLMQT